MNQILLGFAMAAVVSAAGPREVMANPEPTSTLSAADTVSADTAPTRQHGIELRLWSVFASGIALDYEYALMPRFSAFGGLGLRSSATGDYSGFATTMSVGARFWFVKDGPAWISDPLGGPFVEAALDLQRTTVHDDIDDESLPGTYTISPGLGAGFRVLFFERVSATLHIAEQLRTDLPSGAGRALVRPTTRLGLRLGVVF